MKLSEYFPIFTMAADSPLPGNSNASFSSSESKNSNGFSKFLDAVEQRDEVQYKPKDKNLTERTKEKPAEDFVDEDAYKHSDDKAVDKKNTSGKGQSTEQTKEKPNIDTEKSAEGSNAEEQALNEVAEILEIPVESLVQMLAALNLKVSDLTDPSNVSALMQVALDAPSPAALLIMPQFLEMFKAVNDAMAGFKPVLEEVGVLNAAKQQSEATNAQTLENMQVTVDESGETQVTFNDGLNVQDDAGMVESDLSSVDVDGETKPREVLPRTQTTQQNNTSGNGTQSGNSQYSQQDVLSAEHQDTTVNMASVNTVQSVSQSTAAETVRAASASVADANDVMNQIMSRIRTSGDSFSEIRLTLKPENLGDISLRVSTQNGIVTAQFVAESQRIKEIIEANFNQLRDVLSEQGVNLSALNVSVRQEGQEHMAQFEQGRQSSRARIERIAEYGTDENETEEPDAVELMQSGMNIHV